MALKTLHRNRSETVPIINVKILPGGLIHAAANIVSQRLGFRKVRRCTDRIGTYAYLFVDPKTKKKYFVVSKRKEARVEGEKIVSITKRVCEDCIRIDAEVLLYIEDRDKIFLLNDDQIRERGWINEHNGAHFINFHLRECGEEFPAIKQSELKGFTK